MKRFYLFLFFAGFFFSEGMAQVSKRFLLEERQSMPYMAPPEDQRSTPAFRYDSANFFTTQVNVNSLGGNLTGDAANEPSIAVDPTNPNRIVIGWRQFDNVESSFRQAGYAYSMDGGEHWNNPGVVIDPGNFRSDPVLDFDSDGNFYYNSLGVSNGGGNMWTDVFRITDGGFEWDEGTYAWGGDKQWMRIDRTESIGEGNIYCNWTQYYSVTDDGSFTRSTDGGDSYENCVPVIDDPFWGTLAVGPEGELYEVGNSDAYQSGVLVVKSINAKYADSIVSWHHVSWVNLHGKLSGWSSINPQGLVGQAWVDVDRSEGEGRGYVYVLASVQRTDINDPADVMFARSTDGGITWDEPIRINTDTDHSDFQWMGTMSVAPDGRIDVVWLDTRDAPSNQPHKSALYYSYSIDHGETFSPNEKLTPLFDPHLGYPQQQKMGDYFDMVSDLNGAHLAWAATFNGEEDVYYAHIVPSCVTKVSQPNKAISKVTIYPNPVDERSVISYQLDKKESVTIEIFDNLGRKMSTRTHQVQQKGVHKVKLLEDNLLPGIYLVVVKTEEWMSREKFVVR